MFHKIKNLVEATSEQVKAVMDRYRAANATGKDNEGTEFLTQGRAESALVETKLPLYSERDLQKLVEQLGISWDPGFSGRVKRYVASDQTVDSYGDIILQDGWDLKRWKANPVIMWVHDYRQMNIGSGVKVQVKDEKLLIDVLFALAEDYAWADTVYRMVDRGFLKGNSVGFIPRKISYIDDEKEREKLGLGRDGVVFEKSELLEDSICPIGANPAALVQDAIEQAVAKGIIERKELELIKTQARDPQTRPPEPILETIDKAIDILKGIKTVPPAEDKTVIPFKHYPLAPEDTSWSAGKEIRAADVKDLKIMCTWYDSEHSDTKGAYKLPHHRQADKYTVWRGVAAAMGALLGARGGVDIPDADKRRVYNHLKKHYAEFEKEPPEFKDYTEDEIKALAEAGQIIVEEKAAGDYVDTDEEVRYQVRNVKAIDEKTLRYVTIKKSKPKVLGTEGKLKEENGEDDNFVLVSLRFPKKDGWDVDKAEEWVKDHPDVIKIFELIDVDARIANICHAVLADPTRVLVQMGWKDVRELQDSLKAELAKDPADPPAGDESLQLLKSMNSKLDGLATTTDELERQVIDIENRTKYIEDTLQERTPSGGAGREPKVNAGELADVYLAADKILEQSKSLKGDS